MKTVYDALDPIVNASLTQKEKGTKYEAACVWYLSNDPFYSSFFSRAGTIEQALEWPGCPVHDSHDVGIDLMAQERATGAWWAIQCKCRAEGSALTKAECDSFFARALADAEIDATMVMTSAGRLAPNLAAQVAMAGTQVVDTAKMAASNLDWEPFITGGKAAPRTTHDPRKHQAQAIELIEAAFQSHDRAQAIMACGTGKTLMALRLAEDWCPGGAVLFCAPSISLVGQSMRAWLQEARSPLSALVVCSDPKASRRRAGEDYVPLTLADFEYPATTDPARLMDMWRAARAADPDGIVAVFSTYQSIDVVHGAQELGLPAFDLCICDEAHRTTGSALPGVGPEEASAFMKVHYEENVHAKKRLYMTATPRIYGEKARRRGAEEDYTIASMDDEELFGPVAYRLEFGEAMTEKLLCDYRVVVLTVPADALGRAPGVDDSGLDASALEPGDFAKIVGCWKGLADHGENAPVTIAEVAEDKKTLVLDMLETDPAPQAPALRRAVGFCSTIKASKATCEVFADVVERYRADTGDDYDLACSLEHVDGTMPSSVRVRKLDWLAAEPEPGECRMLTNARCLSEGIDVPALDAVVFFSAKNSVVDIVQAVGRVMRTAPGKECGYIILPVVVPEGMTPEEALDESDAFANVWSVLQALRSHDDRIEALVNTLAYEKPDKPNGSGGGEGSGGIDGPDTPRLPFPPDRWADAVRATIVRKCGTRIYWKDWADDVASIAAAYIGRVGALVEVDPEVRPRFLEFLASLRDSLNPGISEADAVEMVAQHAVTVPVFEALFGDFEFAAANPVSQAIDSFMGALEGRMAMDPASERTLNEMYASVRRRAATVRTDTARQQLIRELYEGFFSEAFKADAQKLGIVYTPTEVIDYILRETDRALRREFGRGLADEGVHVLDPFAGTGSFMAHLIESDLIPDAQLPAKYAAELHSNEIMLLAYYIMTVNIEYAYHSRVGGAYAPFEGAVLTDTFQMTEEGDRLDLGDFIDNSERVLAQSELPITAIVGNPPYSVGQKSANDDNQNEKYPTLDRRIAETYVVKSETVLRSSLYDSYVRAFRWASDRIGGAGVVCFVSNAGWVDSAAGAGMRRCLAEEFTEVRVFHLRGDQYTSGEESRREGGKVFGSGSRVPIAITMLVRNPARSERGRILFHDVGDYLTREEKLHIVARAAVEPESIEWTEIHPDSHGDWLNQRDDSFYEFAPLGVEKYREPQGIFATWSNGVKTQRDPWAWNYSHEEVAKNMKRLIEGMDAEIQASRSEGRGLIYDAARYSWTRALRNAAGRGNRLVFDAQQVVLAHYRPFSRQFLYFDRIMNEVVGQQPKLFPIGDGEACPNVAICVSGASALITDCLPDLHFVGDAQCFPLWWYEEADAAPQEGLLAQLEPRASAGPRYIRHDAVTDEALAVFRGVYPHAFPARRAKDGGAELGKEDIFYYVYGILHSPEYRERFAANLKKELPRVPLAGDFRAFSGAGRQLAALHLNYESVERWPGIDEVGDPANPGRTEKITFGRCRKDEEHPRGQDMTVLRVAENLTLKNVPLRAYDYVISGKSAIGWLMDRYRVTTDKASGIVNDPNAYSDDPRYITELVERVVTVSMRTLDIVDGLPALRERPRPEGWPVAWRGAGA